MKTRVKLNKAMSEGAARARKMEIDHAIERASAYLVSRRAIESENHVDRTQVLKQINAIIKRVKAIDEATARLLEQHADGPLLELSRFVKEARNHALSALAPLSDARIVTAKPQVTRALVEQQAAVTLAHGICRESESRHVRSIAKRIMTKAKIAEPEDRTITNWIKELKKGK